MELGISGPAVARLGGVRALIVDDEFIIGLEIESMLMDAGATVVGVCTTISEALDLAGRADVSIATLDIRIGRDTTATVAALLAERGIPFVFFSGQPLPVEMQGLWPESLVIAKPADQGELVNALGLLMRRL
jgi:two-component SAPR family response regulator